VEEVESTTHHDSAPKHDPLQAASPSRLINQHEAVVSVRCPALPACCSARQGRAAASRSCTAFRKRDPGGVEVESGPVEGEGKAGRVVKWTRRTNGTVLDFFGSLLFGARATSPLLLLQD
jgi:hypothetical protein